jgi:starch phosphorylase
VYADDKAFRKEFQEIKYSNKIRLAKYIKETTGVSVNPSSLFDIQVKRIHEYKRQQLNIFGVIHRYITLKALSPEARKKVQPRVSIFGGKAAPGYWMAKCVRYDCRPTACNLLTANRSSISSTRLAGSSTLIRTLVIS